MNDGDGENRGRDDLNEAWRQRGTHAANVLRQREGHNSGQTRQVIS